MRNDLISVMNGAAGSYTSPNSQRALQLCKVTTYGLIFFIFLNSSALLKSDNGTIGSGEIFLCSWAWSQSFIILPFVGAIKVTRQQEERCDGLDKNQD